APVFKNRSLRIGLSNTANAPIDRTVVGDNDFNGKARGIGVRFERRDRLDQEVGRVPIDQDDGKDRVAHPRKTSNPVATSNAIPTKPLAVKKAALMRERSSAETIDCSIRRVAATIPTPR